MINNKIQLTHVAEIIMEYSLKCLWEMNTTWFEDSSRYPLVYESFDDFICESLEPINFDWCQDTKDILDNYNGDILMMDISHDILAYIKVNKNEENKIREYIKRNMRYYKGCRELTMLGTV
jgi:hypothetical protein